MRKYITGRNGSRVGPQEASEDFQRRDGEVRAEWRGCGQILTKDLLKDWRWRVRESKESRISQRCLFF